MARYGPRRMASSEKPRRPAGRGRPSARAQGPTPLERVRIHRGALDVAGKEVPLHAGAMHYVRLERSAWRDGLTSLQYRRTAGAITEQLVVPLTGGDVIQLERRGNTYIFSSARFGEPFVSQTLADLDLGEELFVGLFACSHDAKVKEEIIFKDVRIIQPPKAGYQPYRE